MIPQICLTAIKRDFKKVSIEELPLNIELEAPKNEYILYDLTRNAYSSGYLLTNETFMNDINLKLKTCLAKSKVCMKEITNERFFESKLGVVLIFGAAFALGAAVGAAF